MQPRLVGDITTLWAQRQPDAVALRDRAGNTRTYRELEERTNRLAHAMRSMGLSAGDRVALWMSDGFPYVEVVLASAKAGLIACPINARLTDHEARVLIEDCDPRLLIWSPALDENLRQLGDVSPRLMRLRLDEDADYERLLASNLAEAPSIEIAPDDPLLLGYTSGTTGRPKGAILSHRAILEVARINAMTYRLGGYPRVALTGSMSFVSVIPAHVLCTLRLGGSLTIMGKWTVDDLMDILERDRTTFTYIPSPLVAEAAAALASRPAAHENLRSVLHSASRARREDLHALVTVVGPRLVEGWGMTENSGGLMTATLGHEYLGAAAHDPVFASVGRAAVDVVVEVLDEHGEPVPHDGTSIGELVFRAPSLMSGYWNRPEDSANALRDGWFHTGDLGSIDPDGYVTISDRRTDLIVSGGANIYPSELEACIMQLSGVIDVAVVGVPHERWGQTPVVAVVTDDPSLTEQAVIAHCKSNLAGYKKPTSVLFFDELPRTAGLKISRTGVRELVRARMIS